jgi:hypothetical protein
MSKAMAKTRRHKSAKAIAVDAGALFIQLMQNRLTNPDPRSHAEFLRDMRTKQATGRLANPATAALLDRLERVI